MTSNASRDQGLANRSTPFSNDKSQSAAFRGASHAFFQASTGTKLSSPTKNGTDGALTAASRVGTGGRRLEDRSAEGSPSHEQKPNIPAIERSPRSGFSGIQESPHRSCQSRGQSPSQRAALVATSKTTPTRHGESIPRSRSYLHTVGNEADTPTTNKSGVLTTSTGDTTSLVQLFESKQVSKAPAPVTHSVRYVSKQPREIASPNPTRQVKRSMSCAIVPLSTSLSASESERETLESAPRNAHAGPIAVAARLGVSSGALQSGLAPSAVSSNPVPEPPGPTQRGKCAALEGASLPIAYKKNPVSDYPDELSTGISYLQAEPGRQESPSPRPIRSPNSSIIPPRQASISGSRPPISSTSSFDEGYRSSSPLRPSRTTTLPTDNYVPKLTIDSLANAMVASSLASSRAPSPSKPPPLPPPRRHGKSYSLFSQHHSQEHLSRTPSPAKGMRQTMREPQKSDDEMDHKKRKGHIVRKHPNKHHEGDRKRYRNQVIERERKRYEGVWAANKGLLMESDPNSRDAVLNVVVRDIWSRSRLPSEVLEEVWDLVDVRGDGKLEREEFVVGFWLIESRLRGNKLPSKVSESMWASVRRLSGVKEPHHHRR